MIKIYIRIKVNKILKTNKAEEIKVNKALSIEGIEKEDI